MIPGAFNALRRICTRCQARWCRRRGGSTLDPGSGSLFAPSTRFNGSATPHRVFEARFHDLADFKRIKSLRAQGDDQRRDACLRRRRAPPLPGRATANCPTRLSSRPARRPFGPPASAAQGGNRLFGRLHPLGTSIADPLERLAAIVDETSAFRDNADSAGNSRLMELVGVVPTTLLGLTVKAASAMPFSAPTIASTTVSNVPGPTEPIYFAGARLQRVTGLGPLIGGMNLFHVVASYNGTISIGATADRSALPDPAHYADCMQTRVRRDCSAPFESSSRLR